MHNNILRIFLIVGHLNVLKAQKHFIDNKRLTLHGNFWIDFNFSFHFHACKETILLLLSSSKIVLTKNNKMCRKK